MSRTRQSSTRGAHAAALRLGDRLRQLRVAAGMTQTELAGDRFSKEYVSQIERGKTRPTSETIDWLAGRLGVDPGFLASGVSTEQRDRVEAALARAEALTNSDGYLEAVEMYDDLRTAVAATGMPELEVRLITGEAKALIRKGEVRTAIERLLKARELTEGAAFSDVERADVLYKIGICRFLLNSVSSAIGLLNQALALAEQSGLPCDLLLADILHWRSRCYRNQRDYEAAREDVERALELAKSVGDARALGHLYFQASLIADQKGHWVLARNYAEKAKTLYEEVADRTNVGRLLNNLGGLNFQLGHAEEAVTYLKQAFATAIDVGNSADAAQAVSTLAQVHLKNGDAELAEQQARQALELLGDRIDFLYEIGNTKLVLGRALMAQDRLEEAEAALVAAEEAFRDYPSPSYRASAWLAQGDLAARRGDEQAAARLFRKAAETLLDVPGSF